jgi:two-component system cell cycle sensor histidine kinase/response regulator CckA
MAGQALHLLIVEDSAEDAALIVHALEHGGRPVTFERVQTADAMRAALSRPGWDLVISDYQMPAFSAPAALEVLKSTGLDLPFLIVSGTVGEETAVAALKSGAHDFLIKGRLARLVPAVDRELREMHERRDRRRAEEALQRSEGQYRSLVEHAVFGIYQSTPDGRLLTANPALVAMLGYESAADLLRVPVEHLYADRAVRGELARRCLERGQVVGAEVMWRRKNREEIRVRLHGRVRTDPDTADSVFEVVVEDVTEQRRVQDELRQAQKMEAIGQLAGGVAHDFNNMLTAILGYAELLTEQIGPDKPIGSDLREIMAAAERAATLTRQLLAFSRKQVLALAPVDLSVVVRNLQPMLRRVISGPVKIDTVLAEDLHPVLADTSQMEHLLVNLCVNARDAMPTGGTLTISTGNVIRDHEDVVGEAPGQARQYATLRVGDTGTGMTPDVQRRIFEPFFTTKERGHGTGLGLAAVYGTVRQLGGLIDVETEPGRGSTFTISLPKTAQLVRESPVAAATGQAVGRETILLVEDEPSVRAFAKIALQRFGYHIVEADSAETALRLLPHVGGPVHLLLTDIVLPGIDGRELALRVTRELPDTRVLFTSGYAASLIGPSGLLLPGAQLLEKPFTAQALLAKARMALDSGAAVRR